MIKQSTNPAIPFIEVYGPFVQIGETISDTFDDFVESFCVSTRRAQVERRHKKTEKALMSLSDHMLHDIGVARHDIPAVARKSAIDAVYGYRAKVR